MKEKANSHILRKYLSGKYSYSDFKLIKSWFLSMKFQRELKKTIKRHWDEFEQKETPHKDLSHIYQKLRGYIIQDASKVSLRRQLTTAYMRIAALLLLPLMIFATITFINHFSNEDNWVEVISPKGTRTHFRLPDGSTTSLNGGTHLFYHINFERNRKVKLEGEAYFEVVRNADCPFVVKTSLLDVQVLGTKFSINSFDDEKTLDIVLKEGSVKITGNTFKLSEILKPDEAFYYHKDTRRVEIKKVDAEYLTAWKDELLIFRSEPLSEVMRRISRWYNVKIDFEDEELQNLHYRATFRDEPLEEVLRLISLTAPVEYEIKERNLNKDGILESKRIIIKRKK